MRPYVSNNHRHTGSGTSIQPFGYEADKYSTKDPSDTTQATTNRRTIQILRRNSYHQQAVRQTPAAQSVDQVDAA